MFFYSSFGAVDLFWSDRELTEAEQKERGLHREDRPNRIYGWLCSTRHYTYEIRPALNPEPRPGQKIEAFIAPDPGYRKLILLRYSDTPV